jgi:pyrimidine-specific ribonucleoside hydrolase
MKLHLLSLLFYSPALLVTLLVAFQSQPAFVQTKDATSKSLPMIFDDDGSPDGMIALAYMLQNPKFNIKAITIVQGEAHPDLFVRNVMRLLARIKRTGIPVAAGRSSPLVGQNAFPERWRTNSDNFWGVSLPRDVESVQPISAAQLIVKTLKKSPQSVTILAIGPLTNLAEALRIDPSIASKIARVQIMGGALYVPGNLTEYPTTAYNTTAEWNIWVDPVAAEEVFSAGLPVYLTPLDATNQVKMTRADGSAWRATGTPEGILASDLLNWFFRRVISRSSVSNWDTVAAINLSEPSFCSVTPLHLDVKTTPGDDQGRILTDSSKPANVNVCLNPNPAALPNGFSGIFHAKF